MLQSIPSAIKRAIPQSLMPGLGAIRRILGGQHPIFPASISTLTYDKGDMQTNGELFLVRAYAHSWRRCFDIGANKGEYARMIQGVNPACEITVFEPNPSLLSNLHSLGAAAQPAWTVCDAAVGECSGEITLHVNPADDGLSSIHRPTPETKATLVRQVSIDDYCRSHDIDFLDFCKIDAEGNELSVLAGAKQMLSQQRIAMIQFEYNDTFADAGVTLLDAYRLFGDRYIICHMGPVGLLPMPYNEDKEIFRYSNWVAVSLEYLTSLPAAGTAEA